MPRRSKRSSAHSIEPVDVADRERITRANSWHSRVQLSRTTTDSSTACGRPSGVAHHADPWGTAVASQT